jgi:hypothetical protein
MTVTGSNFYGPNSGMTPTSSSNNSSTSNYLTHNKMQNISPRGNIASTNNGATSSGQGIVTSPQNSQRKSVHFVNGAPVEQPSASSSNNNS